jgi:hypothetical protein
MSETMKRFLGVASIETVAPSKGELIVVAPTLAQLADTALRAHNEVEKAALTAVLKAIEAGKALNDIKQQLPHGSFEDFVAGHFKFAIRTAQSYMRLAKKEAEVRQLVETKAQLGAPLSVKEALKYLNGLGAKKRR